MPNTKNAIGYPNADGSFGEIANNNPKYDGINAADVSFDNKGTGMSATNVQGAIGEVNSKIGANECGTAVDLSSYEYSSGLWYTFPSDGYISPYVNTLGERIAGYILTANSKWIPYSFCYSGFPPVYVRKGMKFTITFHDTFSSNLEINFLPLEY